MSKNQMERFISNNNMKKNKKHTVIHGAIDVEHYNNQLFTSIKKQKLRFIYTTCIERGLISLVEQFEKIRKTYPEATLYIFSDFSGKYNNLGNEVIENLKTRIREIGNIYINNRVDQQTLAIEFMKSEYWIYPANCPETFCISAVEAMAAGCFCIYKNIGALPEVVHVKGACIDNDDEIYNIVYNAEETDDKTNIKKRLSYSARLTAMSKYNYDVFFDKWISLIDL
jgi:glycosyltransferase involved in cell wall biosynthesis